MSPCQVEGCDEVARLSNGFCYRHGAIVRAHGHLPSLDFECVECGKFVERLWDKKFQNPLKKTCDECVVKQRRDHRWFRDEVIKSGGADCDICGEVIDLSRRHPDPECLSIDHVVPISLGGSNEAHNLAPTHLVCNLRKGGRIAPRMKGVAALF